MYQPLREDVLSASPVHPERRRAGTHEPGVAAVRRAEEADYVGPPKPILSWRDMHDLQRELQRWHEPGDSLRRLAARRFTCERVERRTLVTSGNGAGSGAAAEARSFAGRACSSMSTLGAVWRSAGHALLAHLEVVLPLLEFFRAHFSLVCMLNYAHILEKQLAATSATPSRHTVLPSNPVRPAPLLQH